MADSRLSSLSRDNLKEVLRGLSLDDLHVLDTFLAELIDDREEEEMEMKMTVGAKVFVNVIIKDEFVGDRTVEEVRGSLLKLKGLDGFVHESLAELVL